MNQVIKSVVAAVALISTSFISEAQTSKREEVPKGWHLLDKSKDGYYGISINEAYEFVKSKNPYIQ